MQKKPLAVVIMRAQGPTNAHFSLIEEAAEIADNVLVLLGSANMAASTVNPWSFHDRSRMLQDGFSDQMVYRVKYAPLNDHSRDGDWVAECKRRVKKELQSLHVSNMRDAVTIVGHDKDETSYYLKLFNDWTVYEAPSYGNYNATDLRNCFFSGDQRFASMTRPGVVEWLNRYKQDKSSSFGFDYIVDRYKAIADFRAPYEDLPFGIRFITGDPLVICDNHVLMVLRDEGIGKGQWALPGGFSHEYEDVNDTIERELKEETSIDIPERALRQAYRGCRRIQKPKRDERGDFITYCGVYLVERDNLARLPEVTPQREEVSKAEWIPVEKLDSMSRYIFLDHKLIIDKMRAVVEENVREL